MQTPEEGCESRWHGGAHCIPEPSHPAFLPGDVGSAKGIASAAAGQRLPSIGFVEIADSGGPTACGANIAETHRRALGLVDKILKGAGPADLPVEQPVAFELLINTKDAKALGIKIPISLLGRATRVIE